MTSLFNLVINPSPVMQPVTAQQKAVDRHRAAEDNTHDALDTLLVDGGVKLNRLEDLLRDI